MTAPRLPISTWVAIGTFVFAAIPTVQALAAISSRVDELEKKSEQYMRDHDLLVEVNANVKIIMKEQERVADALSKQAIPARPGTGF